MAFMAGFTWKIKSVQEIDFVGAHALKRAVEPRQVSVARLQRPAMLQAASSYTAKSLRGESGKQMTRAITKGSCLETRLVSKVSLQGSSLLLR